MTRTILLALALCTSALAQEAPPPETITITLPGQAPVVLSLPAGSLASMYAVRQAQGRTGTISEVFLADVQRWMAKEAAKAQKWLLAQAQQHGFVSVDDYTRYLAAVAQAQAEAASAAVQPEIAEITEP